MVEDKERLAKIETSIESIEKLLNKLEGKIDAFNDSMEKKFVLRSEVDATVKHLHERISDAEKELENVKKELHMVNEKNGKLPAWAAALLSFLVTLVGALLAGHVMH
jgi:chromosome segregation ATPase